MNNMEEYQNVKDQKAREDFVISAKNLIPLFNDLLISWERLNTKDNIATSEDNMFNQSFDEWFAEYVEWVSRLQKSFDKRTITFEPTVTVGELKTILADFEDDRQIVIASNHWYTNIDSIQLPDDYETYTITFHLGSEFDTWQIGK